MRFQFDAVDNHDPVWSQSKPDFAVFINALGVHVPYFERFLVKVMRAYRDQIQDEELLEDVQAIIGQESHHAFNFVAWTKVLCERYPNLARLDQHAKEYFETALTNRSKKFKIGFTAGYETFTFLGGMIILNRYEELMGTADPTIRALWVWHQVEEVEHGAVAFDFYKAFYPDKEWYRRLMVVTAFLHISWETFKAFAHMVNVEGVYRKPSRAFSAWRFFFGFARDLAYSAWPVMARSYHPRNHPFCHEQQNAIATAWRKYYATGGDAHTLDAQAMQLLQTG